MSVYIPYVDTSLSKKRPSLVLLGHYSGKFSTRVWIRWICNWHLTVMPTAWAKVQTYDLYNRSPVSSLVGTHHVTDLLFINSEWAPSLQKKNDCCARRESANSQARHIQLYVSVLQTYLQTRTSHLSLTYTSRRQSILNRTFPAKGEPTPYFIY